MPELSIPVLLVGIGVLFVVLAAAVIGRQLFVSRQRGAFDCTLRRRGLTGPESWQRGLMRFGTDRVRWFRAFSMRLSPSAVIRRADIAEMTRRRLPAQVDGDEDACLVVFHLRSGQELQAIVDLSAGAALNSWREAAPTGMVIGDAD